MITESWDAPRPAGTHINHVVHHTHVISTTGFIVLAIYVSFLCCYLERSYHSVDNKAFSKQNQ